MRGSRDEVAAGGAGRFSGCLLLVIAGLLLVTGRRAVLETILARRGALRSGDARRPYLVFVARLRPRTPAPTAVKIIVFGAGDAETQLIRRLATQRGAAYRPVAILDDDLAKRRMRINSVPVLGGRC